MNELTDNELIALHKGGDLTAFNRLYDRYKGLIKSLSKSYYLLGGDCDDLAQEGLLGLLKAANTFDANVGASFKTYATICILSNIKTAIRLSLKKGNIPLNSASDISGEDVSLPNPEDLVIGEEGGRELMTRIETALSGFELDVIKLYLDGHNYSEIAKILGKQDKAVDNALQRAKKKISVL